MLLQNKAKHKPDCDILLFKSLRTFKMLLFLQLCPPAVFLPLKTTVVPWTYPALSRPAQRSWITAFGKILWLWSSPLLLCASATPSIDLTHYWSYCHFTVFPKSVPKTGFSASAILVFWAGWFFVVGGCLVGYVAACLVGYVAASLVSTQ